MHTKLEALTVKKELNVSVSKLLDGIHYLAIWWPQKVINLSSKQKKDLT